ncbi:PREDICTED: acrosin-binding protein [Chaetura pelagica]|uniref:acrosin-binding protein n=1 Tax=Chaetura pelagica TaxID=8897 RepID=UPI00052330AA|nr:PREDICTED: acrosin-binding protein [Chaetura pelagica]
MDGEQFEAPITQEEVVSDLLHHSDTHKSMGLDGTYPRVLRELAKVLIKTLSINYQQSWVTGKVPIDWRLANVTSIYKKGCKEDPGNHRRVKHNLPPPTGLLTLLVSSAAAPLLLPVPGTPLTNYEYKIFFAALKRGKKVEMTCQLRQAQGCLHPTIVQLDQDENHGAIPEGPVCSALPEAPRFRSFCLFAQYRCLKRRFYVKRIPCSSVYPRALGRAKDRRSSVEEATTEAPSSLELPELQETPSPSTPELESPDQAKQDWAQRLHNSVWHLVHWTFSLEASTATEVSSPAPDTKAEAKNTSASPKVEVKEAIPRGSLLALKNAEAVMILCYELLEGNCLTSLLTELWKEIEAKILGFGNEVCDNLGRRHMDLCPNCAFCSLKREQCQNTRSLHRDRCKAGSFITYINPQILAQRGGNMTSSAGISEHLGMEFFGGLRMEYWCGRMATHGCNDPLVALWLKAEDATFHDGDRAEPVCDSDGIQHPNYCAFKSHQCLQKNLYNQKVTRHSCNRNEMHQVLTEQEGENETRMWHKRFLRLIHG